MRMQYAFLFFVLFFSIALYGCTSEQGTTASTKDDAQVDKKSNEQVQSAILSTARKAEVMDVAKNWDEDLADDGLIIYPELRDENDSTVEFEGVTLKVDMEIWTTKLNDNFKEVKIRKIYSGSGTIDNWRDGNFMYDGGIKIPFEDIKAVESDSDHGLLLIKIYANNKTYEAKSTMGVRIKPEAE
ncbi:MAG: hypothetical protein ABIJ21_05900 [Nanoarchaeota archaeon]